MGLFAGELLNVELPRADKRLFVFIETDGCFADAVSVATGCWLGHRTMRLVDHGKIAATIVDVRTGAALRIWPHPEVRARASALIPNARDRWHAQLDAYQRLPVDQLLCSAEVVLVDDLEAIRSRPGRRVLCARCGEEVINEREKLFEARVLCRSCAGERYFTSFENAAPCAS